MTYPCCSGTTGHATWCTSIPRKLAGKAVTYTTVTRHVTTTDSTDVSDPSAGDPMIRYRWRCSCSALGAWKTCPWQAEQGAKTHARRSK